MVLCNSPLRILPLGLPPRFALRLAFQGTASWLDQAVFGAE